MISIVNCIQRREFQLPKENKNVLHCMYYKKSLHGGFFLTLSIY